MAYLYKTFKPVRTALCAVLIVFFAVSAASAQPNPYVIEGVKVDITADNAINARNQAFEKAQQDAVLALAAQFFSPDQLKTFRPPPAASISPMVQDYEVTQEKLSSKRYIGTYTFRFKRSAVGQFFNKAGMELAAPAGPMPSLAADTGGAYAPSTAQSHHILVLPFYQVGRQTILSSGYNSWMQAWRRTDASPTIILPLGDLADTADIGDDEALTYDPVRLGRMLARYNAREAVIAIASPDATLAVQTLDAAPARGSLTIEIYRTDSSQRPEQVGQFVFEAYTNETRARLFERAALEMQKNLNQEWKSAQPVPVAAATRNTIEMRVPFANLQEWAAAQRKLNRIQGVNDVVLKSLSSREARVGIVFDGSADNFKVALQQAGMDLTGPPAEGAVPYGQPVVYFLNLNPEASSAYSPGGMIGYEPEPPPQDQQPFAPKRYDQNGYPPPAVPGAGYEPSANDSYTRSF